MIIEAPQVALVDYVCDRFSLPTGAIAQNMPRSLPQTGQSIVSTGVLSLYGIGFNFDQVVSSVSFTSGGTALTQGDSNHLWAVLCTSGGVVRAVTADDTTPVWAANTTKTFTFAASYRIPTAGFWYVGFMFAHGGGAGVVPTLSGVTQTLTTVAGRAPIMAVASSTGQTTPPSLGASMTVGAVKAGIAYVSAA